LFATVKQIYTIKEVAVMLKENEELIRAIAKYILNVRIGNNFLITKGSIIKIKSIIKYGRGNNKIHEL